MLVRRYLGTMGDLPGNIFSPASKPAWEILHLTWLVLAVTGVIFVIVASLLVYAVVRFRRRKNDDGREPPQFFGSNQIETAWTVVPVLIVLVLAMTTTRFIHSVQAAPRPTNAVDVTVVGHQWWWEVRYPKLGVVTANELHVPVGQATWLTLLSADVAHSFWVPRLAGKTDLIPNKVNQMWIQPEATGLFVGQCAEYCGMQHAKMLIRVYVHTRDDFDRWVKAQTETTPSPPAVSSGKRVFETNACVNCHTLDGTIANGRFGPDLTHLMSRETLAAGAAPNTPETLHAWLKNPDDFKPGAHMPAMTLTNEQFNQLTAYLLTRR
jgi:cytochrome c oxidase subunit 2